MKFCSLKAYFHAVLVKKTAFKSDEFLQSYDSMVSVYILEREILRQYMRATISLKIPFFDSQTSQIDAVFTELNKKPIV